MLDSFKNETTMKLTSNYFFRKTLLYLKNKVNNTTDEADTEKFINAKSNWLTEARQIFINDNGML